jgi:uncharacterized membrane protein
MMPHIPEDLKAVLLLTFFTIISVFVPQLNTTPLRVVFGLPFVLFLPGYALIAALFPRKSDLDGIERVALSFGLSIAVVPLIGLILNYTPFGIRLVPIAVALSVFTFALTFVAIFRRNSLPIEERFKVSLRIREKLKFESESGLDRALSVLLVISIIAAVFALVYVIATPKQGERFTEFYVLGSEGLAADYPLNLVAGRESEVRVGVVNQEYESLDYNLGVVLDNRLLLSLPISLAHNSTWEEDITFTPDRRGEALKLEFLLYKNASPEPYRSLHLWVDVT